MMMLDARNQEYVELMTAHFAEREPAPGFQVCPECGAIGQKTLATSDDVSHHVDASDHVWTSNGYMVIGCEGYWMFDPALVGIHAPNWTPVQM